MRATKSSCLNRASSFCPGVRAEATFYKGLFGKLGVEADFVHIGTYKGAAEPLTHEKFSEPVRENMTALVDSMYDELVTTIVKHRPISIAQAKEVIDRGMVTARQAKELGLIDRIAYPDELRRRWPRRRAPRNSSTSRTTARKRPTPISPARPASSS